MDFPKLLIEFTREQVGTPFEWGQNDCCMFAANWIEFATGVDPAAHLRRSYETEAECDAFLSANGGVLGAMGQCLESYKQVMMPRVGFVACVRTAAGDMGAIRGASGWLIRTKRGGVATLRTPDAVRVWAIY